MESNQKDLSVFPVPDDDVIREICRGEPGMSRMELQADDLVVGGTEASGSQHDGK